MERQLLFSRNIAILSRTILLLPHLLLIFLFMPNTVSASKILPPQLVVTKVDELCDGGGIINCSLSDPTPGGTVIFRVYLLPNTTSPIAELTANGQVTGLDAGTYQVVAIETVNGNATTLPAQNVTIENHIEPLDFEISHTDEHCGDGTMTINVTSGYAVDFLLFDGPETTTLPHPLNFFGDLEDGTYIVHAIDACGNIKAHSYTVPHNEAPFSVGSMGFLPELPACDQITLTHPVTIDDMEDDDLLFPLTFIYTVYPPDGSAPITVTYTEVTGNPDNFPAAHTVPFWYDQLYFYDLQVIDKCGQSHGWNHAPIDLSLFAALSPELGDCGQFFFSISPSVFVAPYFINFTEVPAGFNPTDFNPGHPGPFTSLQTYYGTTSNTVPMGNYAGTLTDACGHTVSFEQDIQPNEFPPQFTPYPQPGCLSTTSDLQIQTISYEIDHVVVTGAPPEFTETLPYTIPAVPNQQGPNEIWLFDLPAGTYYFTIYDTCGIAHEEEYTINPSSIFNLPSSSTFADCEEGFGGIRIRGGNSTILTSVVITSAPAAYTETLPQDVSIHIGASGIFSMEHLPPGDYGFHLINGCGNEYDEVYPVIGYETQATIDVTKHCAAFDVYLSDVSNATAPNFWLQKLNETTGQWMHPNTGAIYVEGTTLGTTNAIQLTNGINNINQLFLGHFRIVKTFQAYQNGEIGPGSTKVCIIPLQEFDNTGEVRIIDIIKLTCDGALASVKVIADGVEPFHFKIIEKNGQPFVIDNGSNDTFIDLEPAVYKFSVEHFCGQAVVKIVDIATLPSQIAAVQPTIPLIECDSDDNDGKADFDLSQFDATIIGSQNASDFTLTYHATEADANSGANALPQPYYSATATLYARLKLNSGDCYDVVTVEVIVNPYPVLQMQLRYPICPDSSRTITADSGMDSYSWSTGANTQSITVTQAGTYTLTVTKDYQGITCTGVYQIEVFPLVAPTIHHVEYQDWTDHDNTLIIHTNEPDTGDFLYSIDGGVTFQSSNTFNGLLPGIYQVMVKDLGDCGHDDEEAHLLMYPRFFTPNGDGYNDYWKVKFDELEPGIQTYIFDRYGKLITGFPVGGRWDGTYNDKELPSTDYWFVVIRQDGREMRGHFSMKR